MRWRTTTAALALAAVVAAAGTGPGPAAGASDSVTGERPEPTAALNVTRSYYIANGDLDSATNLGCRNGDMTGRMTLFFGSPRPVAGGHGASLWGAPDHTTGEIAEIVKAFARGYAWCRQSASHQLLIGVGTSTSTIDSRSDDWLREHGRAWSRMVALLHDWATRHLPDAVVVNGAWDAEPSWSAFDKADRWMEGYDNLSPAARPLHANNSADGCPSVSADNGPCNNGWTQHHVWHLAWEHRPALPIPQIYAVSGVNARQWAMLSLYGAGQGNAMHFPGAMSQQAACQQRGGCLLIDATPQQSHDFLLWEINSRPETSQDSLEGVTNIRWHS